MIVTRNLGKQFDGIWAVDGVSLTVKAGEVLVLLGPNGAGKTTTVRMLTSVLRPSRGEARVAGFDVVREPANVRKMVGVLTEQHGLYGRMPAEDYLDFFGQLYGLNHAERRARTRSLLEHFGLQGVSKRKIGEFSKGMRQKLALARALLHEPPVLLLDEPTSAMDPESARLVRDAILKLRSASRAIILCTHNLAEAEELADQIAIIRAGKIIARGTTGELKQRLLGPAEYEVRLAGYLNGHKLALPPEVTLTYVGEDCIRFQTLAPQENNPVILKKLLDQGLQVVALQPIGHSLEQIYLQAMQLEEPVDGAHG